jgi:hypothetical protein
VPILTAETLGLGLSIRGGTGQPGFRWVPRVMQTVAFARFGGVMGYGLGWVLRVIWTS